MARTDKMRLGLSTRGVGYHIAAWRHPEVLAGGAEKLSFFVENARLAEAGKLDFLFLADGLGIRAQDNPPGSLSHSNENVELEPLTLLSALAALTSRVGLIATASTSYDEPFHVARRFASLDHISGGRAGWNVVTSWSEMEAQNFNRDRHFDKDFRYARAQEFVETVLGLWQSWGEGAFLHDKASGRFYDEAKLHVLNHRGAHFQVRGPLPSSRTPQGRPVIAHAGASEPGRQIGAAHADLYYVNEYDIDKARAFYADIKRRLPGYGRQESDLKILPGIQVFTGRTEAEAQEKFDYLQSLIDPVVGIYVLCNLLGDFSQVDPDGPIPDDIALTLRTSNADKAMALAREERLTVRQLYQRLAGKAGIRQIIGTPEQVVQDLRVWFDSRACDGFNICPAYSPGNVRDFVELIVPELQARGLFRAEYEAATLRENLGLPMIAPM
jgi:FMN-dependent oxidoreductase (nitrilotriacetate monooxygenase family)